MSRVVDDVSAMGCAFEEEARTDMDTEIYGYRNPIN